jgi:hypothetical protein
LYIGVTGSGGLIYNFSRSCCNGLGVVISNNGGAKGTICGGASVVNLFLNNVLLSSNFAFNSSNVGSLNFGGTVSTIKNNPCEIDL